VPTAATFANGTAKSIPSGPGVVTSTIEVSGAGSFLWDLDLTTWITHRFAADLDITLQSPAGTIVTLTTDNGAGNDNVWNGTLWDDEANPAGQVRYTVNNGLATDHSYQDTTVATPLVPEEALAAFVGENPNGTWLLTLSDDLAGDGGSLARWSLALTTFPTVPPSSAPSVAASAGAVTIPSGPAVVTSTVNLVGTGSTICDVDVVTQIRHTFPADLDITLRSPEGTVVTLTSDNGAGNDHVFDGTRWDDDANPGGQVPYVTNPGLATDHVYTSQATATPLVPEEALGAFLGENPNGTWTLTVSDDLSGDGGSITGFSVEVVTCSCASADLAASVTDDLSTVVAGTPLEYTVTATNRGPSAATDLQLADNLPASTRFLSVSPSAEGQCVTPAVGSGGNVGCTWNGTTAISAVRKFDLAVAVCPELLCGSSVANSVAASSATPDPAGANGSASVTTPIEALSDLVVTQTADVLEVAPGAPVAFTIVVDNLGPSNASGVLLTDVLPTGLVFESATVAPSGTCAESFGLVTCTLDTVGAPNQCSALPAPQQFTVTLVARATLDVPSGEIVNSAFAASTNCLEDPTPEDAEAIVTINGLGGQDPPVVPTLGGWGLLALGAALAAAAALRLGRRAI
jgi:uncharacterized repeat protein (TIGR01451 family)